MGGVVRNSWLPPGDCILRSRRLLRCRPPPLYWSCADTSRPTPPAFLALVQAPLRVGLVLRGLGLRVWIDSRRLHLAFLGVPPRPGGARWWVVGFLPSPLGLVQCNACRPPCRPALVRCAPPLPGTAAFIGLVVRVRRRPPSAPSGGSWLLRWVVRLVLVRSRQLSAVKRPFGWVLIAAAGRSARPGPFASAVCRQAPLRVGLDCSGGPFASGPVPFASIVCR